MRLTKIVVVGSTGSGKSSLNNTLCGIQNEFKVSASKQSETFKTTSKQLFWRCSDREVILIDTPGLADTKGRDTKNIAEMVAALKS